MNSTDDHAQELIGLNHISPENSNGSSSGNSNGTSNGNSNGNSTDTSRMHARGGLEVRLAELERQVAELVAQNAELTRVNQEQAGDRRQLQALLDNIPDRIYFKDNQSRFLKLSRSLVQRLGLTDPTQAIGKTDFDFQPEERAREFAGDEQRILQTGEALINKTEKQVLPNGDVAWTSTTKAPLRDAEGKVIGIVGINRDITAQKQAEERLRQSRDELEHRIAERTAQMEQERSLLRLLIDHIPDCIYAKDPEGRYVLNNLAHARDLGAPAAEDMKGKSDADYFPRELAARFLAEEKKIIETGQPAMNQEQYVCKPGDRSGKKSWYISSKAIWRDAEGKVLGTVGISRDISAQKQTEAKLAYEQQLFQTLLETFPDNIYFKDLESHIVRVSHSKAESTLHSTRRVYRAAHPGDKPDEWPPHLADVRAFEQWLIGKTDFDTFPAEHARTAFAEEQKIIHTGQPVIGKLEKQTYEDGTSAWLLTTKMPWRDRDGNIIGTFGITRNVTNLKDAEESLDRERILLRTLIDNLPDCIYAKDAAGRKLLANPADLKNLRCTKEAEALGKTDFDFFPKDIAEKFWDDDLKVIGGRPVINREEFFYDQEHQKRWLLTSKLPLPDQDGKIVGLIGIGRDITIQKQVEDALRQSEERLREVLRSTRCILNSGEVTAPEDWRGRVMNEPRIFVWEFPVLNLEAAQEVFPLDVPPGMQYQEVWAVSRNQEDFGHMHEVTRDAFLNDKPFYRNVFRCTDKHGVEHWMQEFITIQKLAENRWHVFGINTDITDLKKGENALRLSEAKLRQFTTQLERSNRELQDFAYVASHDLQEPLRKIVVFGERLKEKNAEQFAPESLDYLDRMQKAASRMQTLINDLLAFSRVTTKAQPFTRVNLAEVAAGVVDDLEGRIELVKGRVEIGTLPVIDGEPLQMRQLLQNLIGNALKFRRPEEPPVVKVDAQVIADPGAPDRQLCRLTVSDNCIGFEEKYVDRIFNVFQRLHTRNEYEGTGMGLAIVRKIALYHGGDITAKSKPGEGSTFILTIPATHDKAPPNTKKNITT